MDKKELKEYQKLYFESLLETANRGATNRITFLGFLITINLAILYAIFAKSPLLDEFHCTKTKDLLLYILLTINFLFSMIYFREHYASKTSEDAVNEILKLRKNSKNDSILNNYIKKVREHDKFNQGLTWLFNRIFLALLIVFPICILNFENFKDIISYQKIIIAALFLGFTFGVHFYLLQFFINIFRLIILSLKNCLIVKLKILSNILILHRIISEINKEIQKLNNTYIKMIERNHKFKR